MPCAICGQCIGAVLHARKREEIGVLCRVPHGSQEAEILTKTSAYALAALDGEVYYYLFSNGYCYRYTEAEQISESVAHGSYTEYCFIPEIGAIAVSDNSDEGEGGLFLLPAEGGGPHAADG